jgi:methionyl-tRNA synthetase
MSAGLPLPGELAIHGFLTIDGRKIGKSLGNAVSPDDFVQRYGADAVRYFLLGAVPQFGDSDFSTERFAAVYEADLANGLGNLVSRLLTLAARSGLEAVPPSSDTSVQCRELDLDLPHDEALAAIWAQIAQLNRELEQVKPWVALREGSTPQVREQIAAWLVRLAGIAQRIAPYLPNTSDRILSLLAARPIQPTAPLFPRV